MDPSFIDDRKLTQKIATDDFAQHIESNLRTGECLDNGHWNRENSREQQCEDQGMYWQVNVGRFADHDRYYKAHHKEGPKPPTRDLERGMNNRRGSC